MLTNEPRAFDFLLRDTTPFFDRYPANVCPIAEASNPVELLHYQPRPAALMDGIARSPSDSIRMPGKETSIHVVLFDFGSRDRLSIPNETETRKICRGILVDILSRRMVEGWMIAKGESDVTSRSSILETGGNANGEDGRLIWCWITGGVVVNKPNGRATEVVWAILEGCWTWLIGKDGGEGGYGGEVEYSSRLDGRFMHSGNVIDVWMIREDMLRGLSYSRGYGIESQKCKKR